MIKKPGNFFQRLEERPQLLLPLFWALAVLVRLLVTAKLNLLSSDTKANINVKIMLGNGDFGVVGT